MAFKLGTDVVIDEYTNIDHESFRKIAGTIASTENKIVSIDAGSANDFFGTVAVGNGRIVVGQDRDDDNGTDAGAAHIFDLNGNPIKKIIAPDGTASDRFGAGVAVGSGRIVIGALFDNNIGSAYIFDLDGTYLTKMTPGDGILYDNFGSSVAVNCGRIAVGAYGDDDPNFSGSVYLYDIAGKLVKKITAPDGAAEDYFSRGALAIGCGRIVVGAKGDDDRGLESGSAYIFDLDGNYMTKIVGSDGIDYDSFGTSVAVGSGRIVVGSSGNNSYAGAAYIFDLDGNQLAKITASDGVGGEFFGEFVGVRCGKIVVGALFHDLGGLTSAGAAYIFDLDGNQLAKITASDAVASDRFGSSVAIGCGKIVIGANGFNSYTGAAYIYDLDETNDTYFERILENYGVHTR